MNAAKKGFRSPTDFIQAANNQPALMNVDPIAGVTVVPAQDAPTVETAPTPAAGEGAQAAPAAAQATNDADPSPAAAPAKEKPQKPAKQPAAEKRKEPEGPPPAPWDAIPADAAAPPFNLRLSKRLHAQIAWIADNVPKHRSMHMVCEKAVTAYVEALIAQHYKPEQE